MNEHELNIEKMRQSVEAVRKACLSANTIGKKFDVLMAIAIPEATIEQQKTLKHLFYAGAAAAIEVVLQARDKPAEQQKANVCQMMDEIKNTLIDSI